MPRKPWYWCDDPFADGADGADSSASEGPPNSDEDWASLFDQPGDPEPPRDQQSAHYRLPQFRRGIILSSVMVLAMGIGVGVLGSLVVDDDPTADSSPSAGQTHGSQDDPADASARRPGSRASESTKRDHLHTRVGSSVLVTRVIDGDTVELDNGRTVRLVGIDAPEDGECGYERAKVNLERLVLLKRVQLAVSDENRDQYGRFLRYVDLKRLDAGLRLIQNGNAIARYDSRDGYGYHPRENRYIRADRQSEDFACANPAPATGLRPFAGVGNCAPGYRPCIPPYPPDLDCAHVRGPVYVTGADPHALDADGDGVACEWG